MAVGTYATLAGLRARLFGPAAGASENDDLLAEVAGEVNDFIENFTERVIAPIPVFSATLTADAGDRVATLSTASGLVVGDRLLVGALDASHEVAEVLAVSADLAQADEWEADTAYSVDDIVEPTTPNGHTYRCVVAGTSDDSLEPVFPTDGSGVVDGTVVWLDAGLTNAEVTFKSALTYTHATAPTQRIVVLDGAASPDGRRLPYRPGIVSLAAVEFANGTLPEWRLEPTHPAPGRPHGSVGLTNGTRFPGGLDDVRLIGRGPCADLDDAVAFGWPAVPEALRTVAYNLAAGRWQMRATGGAYEVAPGIDQVQVGAFLLTRTDYDTLRSFRPRWAVS